MVKTLKLILANFIIFVALISIFIFGSIKSVFAEDITNASNFNNVDSYVIRNRTCTNCTGSTYVSSQSNQASNFKGLLMFQIVSTNYSGSSIVNPIKQVQVVDTNDIPYLCSVGSIGTSSDYIAYNVQCLVNWSGNRSWKEIDIDFYYYGYSVEIGNTASFVSYSDTTSSVNNVNNSVNNVNNSVNNVNNSINDSSTDNTGATSSINNMANSQASSNVISNLLTMPITLIQKIIDGMSGTCTPLLIGNLWGTDVYLECVDMSQILGVVWTIIDGLCSGFLAYEMGKKFVVLFNKFTNLKEGGLEEAYD